MSPRYPLTLVGPWYRWERQMQEYGRPPRETRPVFQKYEAPDVGNAFIEDPQRSLRFHEDDCAAVVEGPSYLGSIRRFADRRLLRIDSPIPGKGARRCDLRKLFLDVHKRFYLVVCELHCDTVGFPDACPKRVCESGFVIRRHPRRNPEESLRLATAIGEARRELRRFATLSGAAGMTTGPLLLGTPVPWEPPAIPPSLEPHIVAVRLRLGQLREQLRALWRYDGSSDGWQIWVAHESAKGIGQWTDPDDAERPETIYPLYPLIPDPRLEDHSAEGATLFHGIVPTGSLDTDENGEPQFDDQHIYTIRCFVREHREGCPKKPERGDCHGRLVWSHPTEPYRLASHFDLAGTRNTVVTVQMPDLPALAAQVNLSEVGEAGSVRMVTPPESQLAITVENMAPVKGDPAGEEPQTCIDSIPLITIVAKFVLELFKPIVIFLFKLFYLLPLKFCWPAPALPFSEVEQQLETLDDPEASPGDKENAKTEIVDKIFEAFGVANAGDDIVDQKAPLLAEYDFEAIAELARDLATDVLFPDKPPSLMRDREYEPRVTPRPRVDDPVFVEALSA